LRSVPVTGPNRAPICGGGGTRNGKSGTIGVDVPVGAVPGVAVTLTTVPLAVGVVAVPVAVATTAVPLDVGVAVDVAVAVDVTVAVGVSVAVEVGVEVGVTVAVGVVIGNSRTHVTKMVGVLPPGLSFKLKMNVAGVVQI
jgi:hypothetical protein